MKSRSTLNQVLNLSGDPTGSLTPEAMPEILGAVNSSIPTATRIVNTRESNRAASELTDNAFDVEAAANENAATTDVEMRYSSRMDVLVLANVDWMGDKSSIKQQLQKHADEINAMEPVAVVEYSSASAKNLVSEIQEQVAKIGGKRIVRGSISFDFDEKGARSIVSHATSDELRAAALASPYVAKYGVLIAGQKNHENTGLATLTYGAPVVINGDTVNVGVVVQFDKNGRPRAVNVGFQSGAVFKIDMEKAPAGIRSRVSRYDQGTALPTSSASRNTVSQSSPKSNTKFSSKLDAGYLAAVERGDMDTAQKMVDEAAKAAGYTIKAYHGRGSKFTVFDKSKIGEVFPGISTLGFYFTPYEEDARGYASNWGKDNGDGWRANRYS